MNKLKPQGKSAAIVIVGNEILSGKVQDKNTPYLIAELRTLGVPVTRVSIIPDEVDTIGAEVEKRARETSVVFVCGGMGPTHDDVTLQGIAKAVNRPMVTHKTLLKLIEDNTKGLATSAQREMADLPEGAELVFADSLHFPVIRHGQIYIFPGVPELVVSKFEAIKERFREAPFFLERLYLDIYEDDITEALNGVLKAFPELQLGSYPIRGQARYRTLLTLESKDATYLTQAKKDLISRLSEEHLVQINLDQEG